MTLSSLENIILIAVSLTAAIVDIWLDQSCTVCSSMKRKPWEKDLPKPPKSSQVLQEIIASKLDYLQPKTSDEITCEVIDDWGSITKRSVIRHLSSMAKQKRLLRLDDVEKQIVYLKCGKPRRRFAS